MFKDNSHFLQFALNHYDNPTMQLLDEFESDLKRFAYVNMHLNKYNNEQNDRNLKLALNHIVILFNCFGCGMVDMIRYKSTPDNIIYIETMLYFLNYTDEVNDVDLQFLEKLEAL